MGSPLSTASVPADQPAGEIAAAPIATPAAGPALAVWAVLAAVLAAHAPTAMSMWQAWSRSETYAHGYFVLPIFIAWVWLRRSTLSRLPVRPFWPGLVMLAAFGLAWQLADGVSAQTPAQFAMMATVPVALATVLGGAWVRALALPLAFLFFAVPAGDVLIPYLTEWTADFVVVALRLLGIPVFREGEVLSIPSGHWQVVESCSGIRYLIACTALGTVYAGAMYRSAARRAVFIGGMVGFAIVANWLRALGIVMLAHWTDNQLAVGVDHLIYGWLFFGLIVTAAFLAGARWQQRGVEAEPARRGGGESGAAAERRPARAWAAAAAAFTVVGIWPMLASSAVPGSAHSFALPAWQPAAGWITSTAEPTAWRPRLRNPAFEQVRWFENDRGRRVALHLAAYGDPTREAKLVSSSNQLVVPDDRRWRPVDRGEADQTLGAAGTTRIATLTLAGADGARLVVWQLYWVGGMVTGSAWRAALEEAVNRLRGHPNTSVWLTLYTPDGPYAAVDLAAFTRDMGPAIEGRLRAMGAARR